MKDPSSRGRLTPGRLAVHELTGYFNENCCQ
jgi:hypothetical protein